jgi:hypothetical protein
MKDHPLYSIWREIHGRCYNVGNPNYAEHGAKGIQVAQAWHDFETFKNDLKNRKTEAFLLRKDRKGPYSKENTFWGNQEEKSRDKTNNRHVNFKGQIKCLSQWCDELDLDYHTVYRRLQRGWATDRALKTATRK